METECSATLPQREEGITACRWAPFDEARSLLAYENARVVLVRAHDIIRRRAAGLSPVADVAGAPGDAAVIAAADAAKDP
jgi:hypothetical protein